MAEIKTKPTQASVDDFIAAVEKPVRRADAIVLREMFERVTGVPAVMWGPTIIGFGAYRYRYASGHEGDMCRIGFSPRSANLVLYVGGYPEHEALLARRQAQGLESLPLPQQACRRGPWRARGDRSPKLRGDRGRGAMPRLPGLAVDTDHSG